MIVQLAGRGVGRTWSRNPAQDLELESRSVGAMPYGSAVAAGPADLGRASSELLSYQAAARDLGLLRLAAEPSFASQAIAMKALITLMIPSRR